MKKLSFRTIRADETECRVQSVSQYGVQLLIYKDARVDQNILDETVGVMGWQKSYELIDGQLFCTISIWDEEKNMWISKQDVGIESHTQKEKGRASDAQKRSAFCFGIGRELYTAPRIYINAKDCRIEKDKNGKWICKDYFEVSEMEVTDGKITKLSIKNTNTGEIVFTRSYSKKSEPKKRATKIDAPELATQEEKDLLKEIAHKAGYTMKQVLDEIGFVPGSKMTKVQHGHALRFLGEVTNEK